MGYFNKHYFIDESGERLSHSANKKHAKYGTKNSTSSEKGTDNKKNNTSEYNHEYYEENKEKWEDNKKSKKSTKSHDDDLYYDKDGKARFGHKDYDENDEDFKRTDGEKIEGTNLRTFTNKNGSTIIMGDGIKFSFPPGTKITSAMARQIAAIEKGDKSNKESYVAKMLNAVTGFADKQGLNTNVGEKKKSSGSKAKTEAKKESSTQEKKEKSLWDETIGKYKDEEPKKKSSDELKKEAQNKGKSQTERAKKQKKKQIKQNSQFMHSDIGSILVKDLF